MTRHRRNARVVVFLLLGAIVNVAVAWWCAALCRPLPWTADSRGVDHGEFVQVICTYESFGRTRESLFGAQHSDEGRQFFRGSEAMLDWSQYGQRGSVERCGWPARSLSCANAGGMVGMATLSHYSYMPAAASNSLRDAKDQIIGGIALPAWKSSTGLNESWRALPLRPVWLGFAINTIFYAAILWVVWTTPFVVRRRRRIKSGLCPACAYPVGTSPVCTECGALL